MIRLARALAALAFVALSMAGLSPAMAQFDAAQTYVSSSGGGANAFSVVVPNINQASDLLGVPIRVLMSGSNSSAATLTVSNGSATVVSGAAIQKPTTAGLAALTGSEIASGQISTFIWDGTVFELHAPTLSLVTTQSQNGFATAVNLQINASVNSNQLTIALKSGSTGGDPSVSSPVYIPFRDTTIANGDPVWTSVTGALSFTIGSGNTVGCVSGQMCRLWVVAINAASGPQVCVFNARSGNNVAPINEAALQSSASGTSGGSSAQTYYCGASSVSAKAIRILGYVEVQESVAGTWSTAPTYVQLFGPGIKKPGDVVQVAYGANATTTFTAAGTFVATNTTVSIVPASAADLMMISHSGALQVTPPGTITFATEIRRGTVIPVSPIVSGWVGSGSTGSIAFPTVGNGMDFPNSSSTTTYTLYVSCDAEGCNYPSPALSGSASIIVQEIMG